ncbi:LysR family transcriptional regulator [Bradyrhizobium sp. CCBAU 51753]|uniref:LysR family transcriptional regulator n=1 Tax=Bradyrhizobium sp. CCBAU 51753 TaxID=1325100 RepID=UPI00188C39E0|nr:LysR family transcriptional regulator [Bradyrhizobium sp. CCBAU 51753]QOZ22587.1 LysR family transcriptional regulator [Bradyrhizobium sp. CCBAU 51753]
MARSDTNRSGEMEVFVRVVDLGGFTAAAKNLGLTPSGVSKLVSRLEARLGTRLVNRTTRRLLLTAEGKAFYERAQTILADIEEAERLAGSGAAPRGHLTVNCNIPFGMLHVMPLLPRFMSEHPDVTLDLVLTDTLVDLMQERADVAIRAGPLGASRLIARKLGTSRMAVVAAPSYLARYGAPKTPADLAAHRGIGWTFPRSIRGWPFRRAEKIEEALPPPVARASDGEVARRLTLGGIGLARLALFHIGPDIDAGRLVPVLQNLNPGDREDIHAVYVGHAGPLPARVRAFIDFLAKHIRIGDPALRRGADGKWKIVPGK